MVATRGFFFLTVLVFWVSSLSHATGQDYGNLDEWASPIADYIAAAEKLNLPEFNRALTTLQVFGDRMWIGYGDGNRNLGTPLIIEFRCFTDPDRPEWERVEVRGEDQGAPPRSAFDTGEEQLEPFRICLGTLCQVGVDSNNHDEEWTQRRGTPAPISGNFFRLQRLDSGAWQWQKFRSIPGGEHVHDLAEVEGSLFASGSGAAHRDEWGTGNVFRYLWRSRDGGQTFDVAWRDVCPEPGKTDTRYRHLLAVDKTLYAFGFVNPYVDQLPRRPTHLRMQGDTFKPLTESEHGAIASLLVVRAWNLRPDLGLVVARQSERENQTEAFLATSSGFRELPEWPDGRVVDGTPESDSSWLFLVGDGQSPEAFWIARCTTNRPERLERIAEVTAPHPTCLTVWRGRLFLGTREGKVYRSAN